MYVLLRKMVSTTLRSEWKKEQLQEIISDDSVMCPQPHPYRPVGVFAIKANSRTEVQLSVPKKSCLLFKSYTSYLSHMLSFLTLLEWIKSSTQVQATEYLTGSDFLKIRNLLSHKISLGEDDSKVG